jgi:hypothetical protein
MNALTDAELERFPMTVTPKALSAAVQAWEATLSSLGPNEQNTTYIAMDRAIAAANREAKK